MNQRRVYSQPASPLANSVLKVGITDLLAEYELRHTFQNQGDHAIEAVYSFPVPLDAAFCGMSAVLGKETFTAQILPAQQADHDYDSAIAQGDTAVSLEQIEPGMLCVSLGNLNPGEQGEIVLRFCAALNAADGVARFVLPLVHRPRYGKSLLAEWQQPEANFAVEHPLQAEIRIQGLLADCAVQSSCSCVRFAKEQAVTVLHIDQAMLDRDLVLSFQLGSGLKPVAHLLEDEQNSLGVVTFALPEKLGDKADASRNICLLLDCSGSMSGDAILQSRQALLAVADALHEQDHIQVIRFGSEPHHLLKRLMPAGPAVKNSLKELTSIVEANLGGTEMAVALNKALDAFSLGNDGLNQNAIILVTDGAVSPQELVPATLRARQMGVRVFVVAVGSSAGVDALAPLADQTYGVLERAVPAEPIDEGVMRQLRRVRGAPVDIQINWGAGDAQPVPVGVSYLGDTVTAVARYAGHAPRRVAVSARLPQSDALLDFQIDLDPLKPAPAMRTWAGQKIYAYATADQEQLALRYGLITPYTKAVLVKVLAEHSKAGTLPKLVTVPHMMPAGMVVADQAYAPAVIRSSRLQGYVLSEGIAAYETDIPAFLRKGRTDRAAINRTLHSAWLDINQLTLLAQALAELLLEGIAQPTVDQVVARIAASDQHAIRVYVERLGAGRLGVGLLQELLSEGAVLSLSDRQQVGLETLLEVEPLFD